MAQIGGAKTTSTGMVALYAMRAGAPRARSVGGVGPVGGSKTTSTGRVALHVARPSGGSGRGGGQ